MAIETLANLQRAVLEYDATSAAEWARKTVEEEIEAIKALDALTETIRQVGDRFGKAQLSGLRCGSRRGGSVQSDRFALEAPAKPSCAAAPWIPT